MSSFRVVAGLLLSDWDNPSLSKLAPECKPPTRMNAKY